MSYWSLYFLAKVALHYRGYLGFHWLANLLFALALLVPLASRRWRVARAVAAWPAAIALLYYDSYLPSLGRVLSQTHALASFSLEYLGELLARVWDWKAAAAVLAEVAD